MLIPHPRLTLALAFIALAGLVAPGRASASLTAPRLRPQSPRILNWLGYGLERSASMRVLVDRIEHSDVVVYLQLERTLSPGVAACVTWIASAPGVGYVRVSVRPDLRRADAVAMLAHELQHVVEVIDHPAVQSGDGLADLYRRIGARGSGEQRVGVGLAARGGSAASHAGGEAPAPQGATTENTGQYLKAEQRREAGCPARELC